MTPYEAWTGNKPSLAGLHVFGCLAYVHIPKANRKKLDYKARVCVFVGYSMQSTAYLCYDRLQDKLIVSRDVDFAEHLRGTLYGPGVDPLEYVPIEGGQDTEVSSVGHRLQPVPPAAAAPPQHNTVVPGASEQKDDSDYDSDEDRLPLSHLLDDSPAPAQPATTITAARWPAQIRSDTMRPAGRGILKLRQERSASRHSWLYRASKLSSVTMQQLPAAKLRTPPSLRLAMMMSPPPSARP